MADSLSPDPSAIVRSNTWRSWAALISAIVVGTVTAYSWQRDALVHAPEAVALRTTDQLHDDRLAALRVDVDRLKADNASLRGTLVSVGRWMAGLQYQRSNPRASKVEIGAAMDGFTKRCAEQGIEKTIDQTMPRAED